MSRSVRLDPAVSLPKGFSFATANAGIKASGRADLALVEAAPGTTAAALFTRNRVVAAPVQVGRASLAAARGRVRGVIVNSGNANCATGPVGMRACKRICDEVGKLLRVRSEEVFPSSTGIIGVPLPLEKILAELPGLIAARTASSESIQQFAQAILTTDTRTKIATSSFGLSDRKVTLTGVAKGAGMIHPQLATMLVYVFTDAIATSADLRQFLKQAADSSFNTISIDGDSSTNDTVLLLASGSSGVSLKPRPARIQFSRSLLQVCRSLAAQIVADGEGVKHVVKLQIEQARTRGEALKIAQAISRSLLVKTAWAGADPNWGRILAAIGASGLPIETARVDIYIGKQKVCRKGVGNSFDQKRAHTDLSQRECDIKIRLGRGSASLLFLTTDLTAEYVRINADYST